MSSKINCEKATRGAGDALRWPLIKAEEPSPKHESRERRARVACYWFALLKRNRTDAVTWIVVSELGLQFVAICLASD